MLRPFLSFLLIALGSISCGTQEVGSYVSEGQELNSDGSPVFFRAEEGFSCKPTDLKVGSEACVPGVVITLKGLEGAQGIVESVRENILRNSLMASQIIPTLIFLRVKIPLIVRRKLP